MATCTNREMIPIFLRIKLLMACQESGQLTCRKITCSECSQRKQTPFSSYFPQEKVVVGTLLRKIGAKRRLFFLLCGVHADSGGPTSRMGVSYSRTC